MFGLEKELLPLYFFEKTCKNPNTNGFDNTRHLERRREEMVDIINHGCVIIINVKNSRVCKLSSHPYHTTRISKPQSVAFMLEN